jgi:hypothetical protein
MRDHRPESDDRKSDPGRALSKLLFAILQAGGLAPFFKQHGGFSRDPDL